jgi:hypothetical protein
MFSGNIYITLVFILCRDLTNDQLDAARVPGTGRRPPSAAGRRYCSRREADVIETAERGAGARLIAVLRIHDILGWIRIRMRIRILLFFVIDLPKMPTKN